MLYWKVKRNSPVGLCKNELMTIREIKAFMIQRTKGQFNSEREVIPFLVRHGYIEQYEIYKVHDKYLDWDFAVWELDFHESTYYPNYLVEVNESSHYRGFKTLKEAKKWVKDIRSIFR